MVQGEADVPSLPLGASTKLGRGEDADIKLLDPKVSRLHAIIERTGEAYRISDQASINGTYVNDRLIDAPTVLTPGDQIQLGDHVFRFEPGSGGHELSSEPAGEAYEPVAEPPDFSLTSELRQRGPLAWVAGGCLLSLVCLLSLGGCAALLWVTGGF